MLLRQLMHLLVSVATWIKYHILQNCQLLSLNLFAIVYMNLLKQFGILYLYVLWALKVDYLLAL